VSEGERSTEITFQSLAGITLHDQTLLLQSVAGKRVELRGGDVARWHSEILDHVCTMREVTRPLRTLGTRRGQPGADHDTFFAPLLAARRRAEEAGAPEARVKAFDASALTQAMERCIHGFATERHPVQASERRALTETLLETAAPFFAALLLLRESADAAVNPDPALRFTSWRAWLDSLDAVFAAADRTWAAMLPLLSAPPVQQPAMWRRILKRTPG
jgi:hypothetical protein